MRRVVRWIALGLLVGVDAGCGGDDRGERDRAAFREFKSKTEAACEDVADGPRRRGAPANSTDIPRLAPPAFADVHHLVAVVDRIDVPPSTKRAFGRVKAPGWVQKEAAEFGSALGAYRKLTADAARQLGN